MITRLARRQQGLVTAAQLRQAGVRDESIALRLKDGRLTRVHRGVYAVGHETLSNERRWMAAVLSLGAGAALSHASAASLWGLWRGRETCTNVVVGRRLGQRHGIVVHYSRHLPPGDTTRRRGIPVTTVARTIVDLADVLDEQQLANVLHEAAYRRLLNVSKLRRSIDRLAGRRTLSTVERALAAHLAGSAGTRSDLEDRYLALVCDSALERWIERPKVTPKLEVAGREIEVDFLWPDQKLVVEVDGAGHTRARTREQDKARDRLLRAHGYRVLRVTGDQIDRDPAGVVRTLQELLAAPRR